MAVARLRRYEDGILVCDHITGFSGIRHQFLKPVHSTITGVSIPQHLSVRENWFDLEMEFASDDPVNSLARYDMMAAMANRDAFFNYFHMDGSVYKCRIMAPFEPNRQEFPTADVYRPSVTFKVDGHYRD